MPEIAILMCTYNGEEFLIPQLESILLQSNGNWALFVSDDGSEDRTCEILQSFKTKIGEDRFEIFSGPRAGFTNNFMSLLCNSNIDAKYYALSDQDDIWDQEKLNCAIEMLSSIDPSVPTLYCGRTIIVDQNNRFIKLSNNLCSLPSFKNALVQNIASGNSMVLNRSARDLVVKYGYSVLPYAHDWWLYLLISGAGGLVYFDQRPLVRYRQHNSNIIGMNSSVKSKLIRLFQFISGHFSSWNEMNAVALKHAYRCLTKDNIDVFDSFIRCRNSYGILALVFLKRSGVHRQRFHENIILYLGAILGKI